MADVMHLDASSRILLYHASLIVLRGGCWDNEALWGMLYMVPASARVTARIGPRGRMQLAPGRGCVLPMLAELYQLWASITSDMSLRMS